MRLTLAVIWIFIISYPLDVKADIWGRDYYTKPFQPAFIFIAIFGAENSELKLSEVDHNIDQIPEGVDIAFYNKSIPEQKDYIEGFLTGTMGQLLKTQSPELYQKTIQTNSIAIVSGEFKDVKSLTYLKNTIGIIKAITEEGAVSVIDFQIARLYTPDQWSDTFFEPRRPSPQKHVFLMYSPEKDGIWLHSRGMRTFGMPDISLVGWPEKHLHDGHKLARRFIEIYAKGKFPESGIEIKVEGLPRGMYTQLKGGYDNLDFNNFYIEIQWPK
ncbi:hypothetical protein [Microbulbifer sp. THAF38]|uniref:hypothetical protein n=1 Tax=Microbulbifer sp. THAF38 TaxID=2587856 RepID=UPI001267FCCE|nr:hypothetical protein [Microbulbifer sp. THAF38]QFT56458.1 hypothetical protein FIU95_18075 [Microbulbifer sp. THAF38]